MSYTIYIISPSNYPHNAAFQEVAEGLKEGFAELGYVVPIVYDVEDIRGTAVVFGANLLPSYPDMAIPPDSIIFNLEQVHTAWFVMAYVDLLHKHRVWDYSAENVKWMLEQGIDAKHCAIGYEPCLTRIAPAEEDIDVLFYGSIFGRRLPILDAVEASGLNVKCLFGVYGAERDLWIARSKIVLNLHAYEGAPLEVVRLSYLWANRRFVISEETSDSFSSGLVFVPTQHIPALCVQFAQDPTGRRLIADRGFEQFAATRQSEYLARIL